MCIHSIIVPKKWREIVLHIFLTLLTLNVQATDSAAGMPGAPRKEDISIHLLSGIDLGVTTVCFCWHVLLPVFVNC